MTRRVIIFSSTELLLKSYFENFADPIFSEKIWRSLKPVSDKCLAKAELYSRCIREAFDDSAWPAKTAWEEEIERQKLAAAA